MWEFPVIFPSNAAFSTPSSVSFSAKRGSVISLSGKNRKEVAHGNFQLLAYVGLPGEGWRKIYQFTIPFLYLYLSIAAAGFWLLPRKLGSVAWCVLRLRLPQ